jgi:uncharacterized Zn finger protein
MQGWAALTWSDLDRWAGSRSVSRGRAYQRQGRVTDLRVSEDGRLLATVTGGSRYVVIVERPTKEGKSGSLRSRCTCPVGADACKHAVATVAAFLQALSDGVSIPPADADDPRWSASAGKRAVASFEDFDADEDDSNSDAQPRGGGTRRTRAEWDKLIQQHVQAKSATELAEMVCALIERFPELRDEFQEQIALSEGDIDRLVRRTRRELRDVTADAGWRNSWTGDGQTPDFTRLRRRLEQLFDLGRHDEIVSLGRELLKRGTQQVEASDDEGDTASALGECLPVVFKAVACSKLSPTQRILFAIDAELEDPYDLIGEAAGAVLDAEWSPADWSAVADELASRLKRAAPSGDDGFTHHYRRDRISNWLLQALEHAGRARECLPILEAEARLTGSFERLVRHLIAEQRYSEAERWAREGIDKTCQKLPGIAASLTETLCELARARKDWNTVAAHAAVEFFASPDVQSFRELLDCSKKARCEEKVRAAALGYLENGKPPIRVAAGKPARKPEVAADWPLPVPEYLVPLMARETAGSGTGRPHLHVLIDIAIAEKRTDDVLHWYDRMQAAEGAASRSFGRYSGASYSDRVADAVGKSHPERALEIYQQSLNGELTHADLAAYEAAGVTLRKIRPVLQALGRPGEWPQLLADIRLRHRNRPRFMDVLDKLEDRPIVESSRSAARRGR